MVSRRLRILSLVSFFAFAGFGCAHAVRKPAGTQPSILAMTGTSHENERAMIEQITSIFENGTPVFQYGYVEKLKDSSERGITFGRVGFTSCQDGKDLLEEYNALRPQNRLRRFLPIMDDAYDDKINCDESVRRLENAKPSFAKTFRALENDPKLRLAQDQVENRRYFLPAMELADRLGLKLPWSRLVMYDTYIQHGEGFGEGSDVGIDSIVSATKLEFDFKTPAYDGVDEIEWILQFLKRRRAVLAAGDAEWKMSVDRVDAIVAIHSRDHNDQLQPFVFHAEPFGKHALPVIN